MKKCFILLIPLLWFGCIGEENMGSNPEHLDGTYQLKEVLISPGNLGSFEKVDSDDIIEFFPDGSYRANHFLCRVDASTTESTGTYDLETRKIYPDGCTNISSHSFSLDGKYFTLSISGCIEPCRNKYKRVD